MPSPFGDYHLASYTVLGDRAEIRLRAERTFPGEPKATEIVFLGVAGYHFEHDNFGTILGHIFEQPLNEFLQQHSAQFTEGSNQPGWVPFWTGSVSAALIHLQAISVHAFEI